MNNLQIQDFQDNDTCIFVRINDCSYALSTQSVLEIVKLVHLSTPESLPRHIVGIFEYNDIVINVADPRSILSLPLEPYSLENQIIIMATDEMVFGIIVDEVTDIRKIDRKYLQAAPYHSSTTFAQAIYTEGTENVVFLSMDAVEKTIKHSLEDEHSKNTHTGLLPTDPYSQDILKERSLKLSKKLPTHYSIINEKDQYMGLHVADTIYCVRLEYIKSFSTIQSGKITKVPCTPSFILGLLNTKGEYITIIDIKNYLNSGNTEVTDKSILVTLNSGEFKLGIVVDAIGESLNIHQEELEALKMDNKNELIDYVKDDTLKYILNMSQILSNEKLYIR